ncbi:glycosyltransferase [Asticcacaulis endophyticus]|uniref:Glycosyltransferase 2-like domain-containing protein n=1 Tax=Asticcacaulis endophyticus TaxID=1395890 RepID=A0A918UQ81_9CAUL|nr:glycosyltransferase [Asticcacaulis endophyticus]GGZ26144.1 hypothetical protein GCM10011273_09520 [Asticcacaulis endophyticus]
MFISVIMCTRNRAEQLRRVLETAAAMTVPDGLEWEIVLIDNGSSDHTPDVVQSFSDRIPIRYVLEPKAGLSNARNRGVAEALGEYICWTDDDVLIDPNWLAAYAQAFAQNPQASVFGGVIEPVPETELPAWWHEHADGLLNVLAARDFGPDVRPLSLEGHILPYGANYALRGEAQRKYLYDPGLGVGPHHKRLGEETAVIRAIMRESSGVWVPGARVRHMIPAARLTYDYVGVYYRSVGETWAYLAHHGRDNFIDPAPVTGARIGNVPVWVLKRRLRHWLGYKVRAMSGNIGSSLWHWRKYSYFSGAADFWRREKRPAA